MTTHSSHRPRVLVSLPYGMCARNFLRSDAHRHLLEHGDQVLLTPLADDAGFLAEVQKPGVTVVKMPRYGLACRGVGRVLFEAETAARLNEHPLDTFTIIGQAIRAGVADPTLLEHAGIFSRRSRWLARYPRMRRVLKSMWLWLCDREAGFLLKDIQPDLVYLTHPHSSQDPLLAAAAEAQGVPCVAMVHSWDNLTSKRIWLNRYEKIIVWNDLMKQQAIDFYRMPPDRVAVVGVPQLDSFIQPSSFLPRDTFLSEHGWDPSRALITFACGSPDFVPDQGDILVDLSKAMEAGRFRQPLQLVIRTHPGKKIPGLEALAGKPHIHVHDPSAAYGALALNSGWNGSGRDQSFFMNLVKHSDVFINCFSTTTIEAAALDRPIINIAYDGRRQLDYLASCRKHFDFNHYQPIVASGGIAVVKSQAELEAAIENYLSDPTKDAAGRQQIVRGQCGVLDGKAGQRVAAVVREEVNRALAGKKNHAHRS